MEIVVSGGSWLLQHQPKFPRIWRFYFLCFRVLDWRFVAHRLRRQHFIMSKKIEMKISGTKIPLITFINLRLNLRLGTQTCCIMYPE